MSQQVFLAFQKLQQEHLLQNWTSFQHGFMNKPIGQWRNI